MTAPTGSPAQDASPGVVSTPEPGAAASGAEAGSASSASGSQDSGSGDYLDRVRSGGDFAAQEVRSHQSRADKAEAKLKSMEWIGSLETGRGTLTGDDIMYHLSQYNDILQNPEAKAAIERLRSGGSGQGQPPASGEADDEFLTDEGREIKRLNAVVTSLEARIGKAEFTDGQQALNKHMEQIRKDYGLSDEVFKKASEATAAQIVQWRTNGGENGRRAIESIMAPNGKTVVAGIMLPAIGPEGLLDAQRNRDRRTSERLGELQTDGPSEFASTGREAPPKFTGPDAYLKAAAWARQNPEGHSST